MRSGAFLSIPEDSSSDEDVENGSNHSDRSTNLLKRLEIVNSKDKAISSVPKDVRHSLEVKKARIVLDCSNFRIGSYKYELQQEVSFSATCISFMAPSVDSKL